MLGKKLDIYNLDSIYNLIIQYRKIASSVYRDISIYLLNAKITLYFMVKCRDNSLNSFKSRYVIPMSSKIHILKL